MADEFQYLASIIEGAPEGGIIQLEPGVYKLSCPLVISKPVTLIGSGMKDTTITCGGLGCAAMVEGQVTFEYTDDVPGCVAIIEGQGTFTAADLTFEYTGDLPGDVVIVKKDEFKFSNCCFRGGKKVEGKTITGIGLVITGNSSGQVQNCTFEQNELYGIEVSGMSRVTLQKNLCRQNGTAGIVINGNAQAVVEGNCCRDNKIGIGFGDHAGGVARNNQCLENHAAGILVRNKAEPVLEGNICQKNQIVGIIFHDDSAGIAKGNDCSGNDTGIQVDGTASPLLEGNTCRENERGGIEYRNSGGGTANGNSCQKNQVGIFFAEKSKGIARSNECRENQIGIYVGVEAQPELEQNICSENSEMGILFEGRAAGKASNNECIGNFTSGIHVRGEANPLLDGNNCRLSNFGIAFDGDARGTARHNNCTMNEIGIFVVGKAQPWLEQNRCNGNGRSGITFKNASAGTAVGNECFGNEETGIIIMNDAKPHLESNKCTGNKNGIIICHTARPQLKDNICSNNQSKNMVDVRENLPQVQRVGSGGEKEEGLSTEIRGEVERVFQGLYKLRILRDSGDRQQKAEFVQEYGINDPVLLFGLGLIGLPGKAATEALDLLYETVKYAELFEFKDIYPAEACFFYTKITEIEKKYNVSMRDKAFLEYLLSYVVRYNQVCHELDHKE